ncbi:hypothetical protein D8674_003149 [Pyrus ussuriensis x Pyrus communis]|uniref:Uncharacterized protein n=1 Tax=Pyrus ussuriensis x Pyrus communis TaxID=2448454 RepID=A0A5N5FV51_9ROSA|nr:hypothetical protein D8674_003149 [Pyrus ussuriensis x Pyrus communis]
MSWFHRKPFCTPISPCQHHRTQTTTDSPPSSPITVVATITTPSPSSTHLFPLLSCFLISYLSSTTSPNSNYHRFTFITPDLHRFTTGGSAVSAGMVAIAAAAVTVLAASGKTSSIPNFQISKFGYLPVNKFLMEFFMQKVGAYMKLKLVKENLA